MAKTPKVKGPEAVGFKEIFGVTALSTNNGFAAIFMSTMFMTFMTDYAGLGKLGATLATVLLLAARIIDAVDDPIQGFIMDRGKIGRHGKYKPFFMISIIMTAIGVFFLYLMPNGITGSAAVVTVWVIFFYLVYDIGASFYNQNLLFRTMTNDPGERSKLLIGPRVWVMVIGMMGSAMAAIAVTIQAATGSYKTAYMILAMVAMVVSSIISVVGWFMVKEKHVVEQDPDDKVKFSDFFALMRTNKPMMLNFFKCIATGFIWTFLFAAPVYYVKYGYCADLTTGEVNMEYFGSLSMVVSLMMLFPLLLGTVFANPLLKAFKGDFLKMHIFDLAMQGASGLLMFILQILGLLRTSPRVLLHPHVPDGLLRRHRLRPRLQPEHGDHGLHHLQDRQGPLRPHRRAGEVPGEGPERRVHRHCGRRADCHRLPGGLRHRQLCGRHRQDAHHADLDGGHHRPGARHSGLRGHHDHQGLPHRPRHA